MSKIVFSGLIILIVFIGPAAAQYEIVDPKDSNGRSCGSVQQLPEERFEPYGAAPYTMYHWTITNSCNAKLEFHHEFGDGVRKLHYLDPGESRLSCNSANDGCDGTLRGQFILKTGSGTLPDKTFSSSSSIDTGEGSVSGNNTSATGDPDSKSALPSPGVGSIISPDPRGVSVAGQFAGLWEIEATGSAGYVKAEIRITVSGNSIVAVHTKITNGKSVAERFEGSISLQGGQATLIATPNPDDAILKLTVRGSVLTYYLELEGGMFTEGPWEYHKAN